MAGITNSPFRRLMRKRHSALVVSELVSANGIQYGGQKTLELLKFHEDERIIGLQIFGEDEERLCRAAQYIEGLGADFVDLNMGCPVPKIVSKGGGSALCRDLPNLSKLLTAMVKATRIPVTIKIRTGWDSQSVNALEVARVAADAGVAWVAIHGRTRAQGYSGLADWDLMGTVKAKASLPIIGNGDISTPEAAVEKMRVYGVDAVLIGRGALRNPFLFEQARALWQGRSYSPPGPEDYVALMREQREYLGAEKGSRASMIQARKFLAWYSAGFPGCHDFRRKLFSEPDPEILWGEAERFFLEKTQARDLRFMAEPFLMGGHG